MWIIKEWNANNFIEKIWTRMSEFISNDGNHYVTMAFIRFTMIVSQFLHVLMIRDQLLFLVLIGWI